MAALPPSQLHDSGNLSVIARSAPSQLHDSGGAEEVESLICHSVVRYVALLRSFKLRSRSNIRSKHTRIMPAKNNLSLSILVICALVLSFVVCAAAQSTDNYEPGPDSKVQPNVPKGEVLKFTFANSKIFPGTTRDYWIYVPAQYKPEKPACVLITQDGIKYQSPIVLDNLISRNEVPVIISFFITPGVMKAADGTKALAPFNRS